MVLLESSSANTDPAPRKFWKLETRDSLAVAEAASNRAQEEPHEHDPLAVRVTVKRGRLVMLAAVAIATVVALTLAFSGGVVIETFERQAVSIQKQEKLVEKYNSYSGTVTAAIERPLELFMALVVHVAVLRLMANDVLDAEKRWRVRGVDCIRNKLVLSIQNVTVTQNVICKEFFRGVAVAFSAGATYLPTNGLSAVNVQTREQPLRLAITADDLAAESPDLTMSSTVGMSFTENRPGNPVTNTILRNLVVPQAVEKQQDCGNTNVMVGQDEVSYRIPSQPWQKHLVPTALEHRSMQSEVAASNTAANVALTPDQFPMNESVAAQLLLYTTRDPSKGSAWACRNSLVGDALAKRFFFEHNQSIPTAPSSISDSPTARLTQLLPPSLGTTEHEDREWFLKKAVPTMYNTANESYKNASLRSWNMTFSHVDIEPGAMWVDAVTIEREMATPRLGTNVTSKTSTRYLAIDNAKCDDIGGCMGLDVALPGSGQRLLVSAGALPLAAVTQMFGRMSEPFDSLALVFVRRPEHFYVTTFDANEEIAEYIGDVLMPHNIGTRNASQLAGQEQASAQCLSKREKRLARYINNHIYMESTLQPAYSAAAFFLLQGGVVRDILNQTWTTQRMLVFDGSKQDVNVVVFIPRLNVILTLAGCVVLVAVVVLVLLWPLLGNKSDPLAHITPPHTVANVLHNETTFPPLLLTRSVAPSEDKVSGDNADDFYLQSLSLTRKETRDGGEDDNTLNGDVDQPTQRINTAP